MIEDDELRNIFKVESAEHILSLQENLLLLEKDTGNTAVLDEAFREAHSLKGAARMLGLRGVESLSHRIEEVLSTAKKSSDPLSAEVFDLLYKGIDALEKLVKESITGEPSGVVLSREIEQLKIITDSGSPLPQESESSKTETSERDFPFKQSGESAVDPGIKVSESGDFRIDTIRVETHRLDKLMSQTGELNVTKLRIVQKFDEVKDLLSLWENLSGKIKKRAPGTFDKDKPLMEKFTGMLNSLRSGLYEESSRLDLIASGLDESIGRIRLLPLSTIFNMFQRMVRDLAKEQNKDVKFVIKGGETSADKRIIEEIKDPLMHMIRNAVDHGIEMPDERIRKNKSSYGTIILKAYQTPANVVIEVNDDGRGLDLEAIKRTALKRKIVSENELSAMTPLQIQSLIFVTGISTSTFVSDISGRGVGLDVVRANVERLKGTIDIDSSGIGCSIKIKLPLTLATSKVMIVNVNDTKFAIPVEHIQTTIMINQEKIFNIGGHSTIVFEKTPVPIAELSVLLELEKVNTAVKSRIPKSEMSPCIIISIGDDKLALIVNELMDEQEVVLKQYSGILKRVRNISGSTILGTGEVCIIVNPYDLIKSARKKEKPQNDQTENSEAKKSILVAEDSITVRTQMKRILEGAGYEVAVAVDGSDAYNILSGRTFDALVSDIQMPNMTGLELTEKVRRDKKYMEMPVILVTSLSSDEDHKRGMEAGANAYITKPSFDQKVLLDTLRRLI